jgi:mycofactocin system glycosyltransferase
VSAGPGWRLAPGVLRLPSGRLAGGAPTRAVRLSDAGDRALAALLGTAAVPTGPVRDLAERLVTAGLLLRPPRRPVAARDVTVVVPALSTPEQVAAVVAAVPTGVPVVVVDDGSPTPLEPALPQEIRVVRHDHPRGPAAARNAGAALARTTWIAFLDADMHPAPGWPGTLLAYADDDVVALAPRILNTGGRGWGAALERRAGGLDQGPVAADVGPDRLVTYLPSAALLVRRKAFEQAGGFDEGLRVGEDVDLVQRLAGAGRVRYEADVVLLHRAREPLTAVLHRRAQYGCSAAVLEHRRPGSMRHADVSLAMAVPWALALAVHPLAGALAAAGMVATAPRQTPELPAADARRLAVRTQTVAAAGLGRWLVRPHWPLWLAGVVLLPRRRRVLLAAAAIGWAAAARRGRHPLASVADDAAYSLGVWAGCVRERTAGPLLIRVRLPGREAR